MYGESSGGGGTRESKRSSTLCDPGVCVPEVATEGTKAVRWEEDASGICGGCRLRGSGDLGRELWECEGGILRGEAEGVIKDVPFVYGFGGMFDDVCTYNAGGIGGLF